MKKDEKIVMAVGGISTVMDGLEPNGDVRAIILEECRKAGVTLEEMCLGIREGLSATKLTFDKHGEKHVEDDFLVRHKYIVTGLELAGYLKPKADGGMNINLINMSVTEKEELERIRGKVYDTKEL